MPDQPGASAGVSAQVDGRQLQRTLDYAAQQVGLLENARARLDDACQRQLDELAELRRERDALLTERNQLREALREQGVERERANGNIVDEARDRHRAHIDTYLRLVSGRMPEALRQVWKRIPGKYSDMSRNEALAVRRLCVAVFSDEVRSRLVALSNDLKELDNVRRMIVDKAREDQSDWLENVHTPRETRELDFVIKEAAQLLREIAGNKFSASFVWYDLASIAASGDLFPWLRTRGQPKLVIAPAYEVDGGPRHPALVYFEEAQP
jgi:chromosome segregation ATPase